MARPSERIELRFLISHRVPSSAPGLRTIPHVPAAHSPLGGLYTWVDDECHFAAPREACAYLQTQLDDVSGKLRRAFSDEEAKLKQQQNDLAQRMRGC